MRGAAAVLAFCAALITGCGHDASHVRYRNDPGVIRQSQVDRSTAGSPERAVAEWSRAILFSDSVTAARLYAPALHVTALKLARQREKLQAVTSSFKSARIVRVTDTTRTRATVVARIRLGTSDPGKDVSSTLAFRVKRLKGQWKLAGTLPERIGG